MLVVLVTWKSIAPVSPCQSLCLIGTPEHWSPCLISFTMSLDRRMGPKDGHRQHAWRLHFGPTVEIKFSKKLSQLRVPRIYESIKKRKKHPQWRKVWSRMVRGLSAHIKLAHLHTLISLFFGSSVQAPSKLQELTIGNGNTLDSESWPLENCCINLQTVFQSQQMFNRMTFLEDVQHFLSVLHQGVFETRPAKQP